MAESAHLLKAPEAAQNSTAESRWSSRIAAPQQRLVWDRPSQRRAHAITDKRLILLVNRANGPVKRVLEFTAALAGLIVLSPVLGLVALLIWASDGKSPIYGHKRVGWKSRDFTCWKFRTMYKNGDEILAAHLAADPLAAQEWAETRKLKNDPRVTKIGAFLRSKSIDEFPQLWNVVRGEMALIGPRPITRTELTLYGRDRRFYLLVRPGITGLWQVSGRSNLSYERRVALDREYIETWSHSADLKILWRTVPAVLKSEGAV
jgi:exopolysaccharide production protein ExoY